MEACLPFFSKFVQVGWVKYFRGLLRVLGGIRDKNPPMKKRITELLTASLNRLFYHDNMY
jgi:hypothetical protein